MKVNDLVEQPNGWARFDLSVGGFIIKNCRWHPGLRSIMFPVRYDTHGTRHKVVHAYPALVKQLRKLLESGETETPRDRRRCVLRIHGFGQSYQERLQWLIFDFTVRGFTILGCRWQPQSGSIRLPVSFSFDESLMRQGRYPYRKKKIVCGFGPHINRLRGYLEASLAPAEPDEVVACDLVPAE